MLIIFCMNSSQEFRGAAGIIIGEGVLASSFPGEAQGFQRGELLLEMQQGHFGKGNPTWGLVSAWQAEFSGSCHFKRGVAFTRFWILFNFSFFVSNKWKPVGSHSHWQEEKIKPC